MKKSFTLFEVLVSLVILGVVLGGIVHLYSKSDPLSIYYELQDIENNYIESHIVKSTKNISLQTP